LVYNRRVNMYSQERWLLDRHYEMVRSAEERSRLEGWQPRERLAERVAARLRRLADRIEGEQPVKLRIYGG
jgi:hypothetical protein